ncbi:MAG: NAD(P)-dependent oxidoreductase [Pseudomonadota bacterium]
MAFKIASTRDLLKSDGTPAFSATAFDELDRNPDIDWEWLPEDVTEITADIAARYDGLHVNLPSVTAASVGRPDCRLKIIARNGVGFDTVDVAACAARGVTVTNTPHAIRRPVAVAALTMIFALSGRLMAKDRLVRTDRWNDRTDFMGTGLRGRTLGLIGAGGIGQELIPLARPFIREVVAADPYVGRDRLHDLGAHLVTFEDLLTRADFVVAACPLNDETRHLMNADTFAAMKPTASFINVARGPVHDEVALINALRTGQIASAALDVTEQEPLDSESPLIGMDNVILTPHALCWTDECFEDIARTALRSIVDCSLGLEPAHPVKPAKN